MTFLPTIGFRFNSHMYWVAGVIAGYSEDLVPENVPILAISDYKVNTHPYKLYLWSVGYIVTFFQNPKTLIFCDKVSTVLLLLTCSFHCIIRKANEGLAAISEEDGPPLSVREMAYGIPLSLLLFTLTY